MEVVYHLRGFFPDDALCALLLFERWPAYREYIDDFKYRERVHDEEYDEPPLMAVACGNPERPPFPGHRPQR